MPHVALWKIHFNPFQTRLLHIRPSTLPFVQLLTQNSILFGSRQHTSVTSPRKQFWLKMHFSSVICACARRLFKNIDNLRSANSRIHVVCSAWPPRCSFDTPCSLWLPCACGCHHHRAWWWSKGYDAALTFRTIFFLSIESWASWFGFIREKVWTDHKRRPQKTGQRATNNWNFYSRNTYL